MSSSADEQPNGGQTVDEAPPSGPLSERVVSKNWKWRAAAYDEVRDELAALSPTSGEAAWHEHGERLAAMLADKNAAAAEKAIAAARAFVERAPSGALSARAAGVAKELVHSSLAAARPAAKSAAQALLELLVEAEQVDATVEQLLAGCAHKTPKVRVAALETLFAIVKQFGAAPPLPVKLLLKQLPAFFNDSDAKFRALAADLAVELHRFLGPIVATQLADLRPAQLTDLQPKWAALPPASTAQPTRFLRSALARNGSDAAALSAPSVSSSSSSSATTSASTTVAAVALDAFELAEPVHVLGRLPKTFYSGIVSANWKERTAELDAVLPLTDAPRLAPGDYGEVCSTLRKVIANDANAMCVQKAATVIAQLARGLRGDFTSQARQTVGVLLGKFKERKPFVVTALHAALDEFHPRLLQLGDMMDDLKVAFRDKTPSTRQQALVFVARALTVADPVQVRKSLKPIAAALLSMLNDTLPEVRAAATQAVASLVTAVGDAIAGPILATLDDMKRSNIERAIADAAKKPLATAAPAAAAPAAAARATTTTTVPSAALPSRFAAPPAKAATSSAVSSSSTSTATKPPSGATASSTSATTSPAEVPPLQSAEQAADSATSLLPSDVLAMLASKAWKERVDAATKLAELCGASLDLTQPLASDTVVRTLQATPGWKESNFQVVQAMFTCFQTLAQRDSAFTLTTAALAVPLLVDKLGDVKLGAPAADTLTAFAAALDPLAVFEQVQPQANAHRNSKVKAGACAWAASLLHAFGAHALPWAPSVVAFAVQVMEDPRAKPEAIALLCAIRQHAGSDAAVFARTGDLKPALRTALEAEFAKVADTAVPQPTLYVRQSAPAPSRAAAPAPTRARVSPAKASATTTAAAAAAPASSSEPTDISGFITPALLEQLSAAKWSDRDDAMSRLATIISNDGHGCIAAHLRELPVALANRLTDSNKNLRVKACALVGQLGAALGADGEAVANHLLPPMLTLLGDNRKAMRDAVCGALDSWFDALGLPTMAKYLPAPLAVDSSIVRRTLLAWLEQRTAGITPPPCPALAAAVPPLLAAAEDRNADVRQLAGSALHLCLSVGVPFDTVLRAVDELRPASVAALQPLLAALAEQAQATLPASYRVSVARTPVRSGASPAVASTRSPRKLSMTPSPAAAAAPTPARRMLAQKPTTPVHYERPLDSDTTTNNNDDDDDDDDDEIDVNMGAKHVLSSPALAAVTNKTASAFHIDLGDDEDDDESAADDGPSGADKTREVAHTTVIDDEPQDDDEEDVYTEQLTLEQNAQTWLDVVRAGDPSRVIDALKQWCVAMERGDNALLLATLDAMCAALALLLPMARSMLEHDVSSGASAMPATPSAGGIVTSAPGARFYKYLLNAVKTAFATRAQAQLVASGTLESVLRELLSGLVQPVLRAHADGEILMVAINQLVISVLEFAELSEALLVLLRLLTQSSHSTAHPLRLSETIARAVLKLAKAKLTSLEQVRAVDVDKVMLELHRFLERHPPHAWRADANFELRAVKTLLHSLVSTLGDDVRSHLKLVPLDRAQPPVLVGYVHVMLSDRKRRQSDQNDAEAPTADAAARENVAPNDAKASSFATPAADQAGNEAYMARLRSLKEKYGVRSGGADEARASMAEPLAPVHESSLAETPAAAAAQTTSIAELRARLARIKAAI